ncbi:hypothetical protein J3P95_07150 [Pseudomonas sp. Z5-35]|uniref:hypothetical protein n=1 Tax=unclassified Pseudomonas TaxID=196821 RepID=UPI003DA8B1E5
MRLINRATAQAAQPHRDVDEKSARETAQARVVWARRERRVGGETWSCMNSMVNTPLIVFIRRKRFGAFFVRKVCRDRQSKLSVGGL